MEEISQGQSLDCETIWMQDSIKTQVNYADSDFRDRYENQGYGFSRDFHPNLSVLKLVHFWTQENNCPSFL